MSIVVVGVDHNTAPIELRERLACSARQLPPFLQAVRNVVQEGVLLSTCNRFELYVACTDVSQARTNLLRLLSEMRQVSYEELELHSYCYTDQEAVTHLLGVTCGLYSLVPGEPQIQGQVVEALEIAQASGCTGPVMSALFRTAVLTGKRARSETAISRNAVSISHVAVQLARHLFPNLDQASVLLVGSGQMSELAARNLCDNGAQQLVIINRTYANGINLAQSLGATHRSFSELADALIEADVVISSTTAPHAIITPELMQQVVAARSGRSLLLIDIALPRDIDPQVATIANIHLYNLDDLQSEVEKGIHLRLQETEHVQEIIAEEAADFERWLASLSVTGTISDLRQHIDALRQQELARTMRQLSPALSEREVAAVHELTTRLVNKLLHTPMLRLKDAAAAGQGHVYAEAMRYLFGLEEEDNETNHNRNTSEQARNGADTLGSRTVTSAVAQS